MKLIDELKNRSEIIPAEDNIKIDLKLYSLAHDLAEKARSHLSRIVAILPEFDIHDQNHSEKVIENMENLLGDTIQDLSSYEIFLLYLSAYLHDSGMAPSDFEINTMKLTEGNEQFFDNDFTIKNDTKSPYKFSDAKALIESKKKTLYSSFDKCEKWMFIHKNEEDFIKYLAELFIEYQEFRNGFKKELGSADTLPKFKDVNDYIRVDFIRITHHKRAEQYIKNLERKFSDQIQPSALGKKLSHDLAEVCRAHGENIDYLEKFNKNVKYFGSQSTNLQMVAMILRLADIIHYSFDRAPVSLLSSKVFKSDYSFQEWMVKQSGANYSIDNGVISYSAYCDRPNDYFKLHDYIDWIDSEIQNYFRLQRKWGTAYLKDLEEKVNRDNIVNDESKFLPKRGIGFSLNQKKILELLKGVGLYKDEYACLRELYQNSLDACKCMIAKNDLLESSRMGRIEFGIEENGDGDFIYCLDNGMGMNKKVIEKYLLNVGNSYYNSPDFYKEQAKWNGDFTPTSQFGIGILSCFMIGHTLEIITKTETDRYISCVINGVNGNFYYKEAELIDTEKILHTGTLIKVYLNSEVGKIENENILKWGIGMLMSEYDEENKAYEYEISKWRHHLLSYVSHFITNIPENLHVLVRLNDETLVSLTSKPLYVLKYKTNLGLDVIEDEKFLNNLISYYPKSINNNPPKKPTIKDIDEKIIAREIHIVEEGIEFNSILFLPKRQYDFELENWRFNNLIIGASNNLSIDGILIESNDLFGDYYDYESNFMSMLNSSGNLNFTGEIRPLISIDRKSIISYPDECDVLAEKIMQTYTNQIIDIAIEHIKSELFLNDINELENICDYFLSKIYLEKGYNLFIEKIRNSNIGHCDLGSLNEVIEESLTIRSFLDAEIVRFKVLNYSNYNRFVKYLLKYKLDNSSKIEVENNIIIIYTDKSSENDLENSESIDDVAGLGDIAYNTTVWNPFNSEYDIITNLYPLLPSKLYNLLNYAEVKAPALKKFVPYRYSSLMDVFSLTPFSVTTNMEIDNEKLYSKEVFQMYNFKHTSLAMSFSEINNENELQKIVLMVFVSPQTISNEQTIAIDYYKDRDPDYVRGIVEGWSILFTTVEKQNFVILPGKVSRNELVDKLTQEFWDEYSGFEFIFTDGSVMKTNNTTQ